MLTILPVEAYRDPIVTENCGPVRWHVLSSPEAFRYVFADRVENFPKAPIMQRMLTPYLGQSLFMAEGQDWKAQRRALSPIFKPTALRQMSAAMEMVAEQTVEQLVRLGRAGASVPISFQMRVMAMEMVRHTMFTDLADQARDLGGDAGSPNPDGLGSYRAGLQANLDRFLQDFGRPGIAELLDLPAWLMPWRGRNAPPTAAARSLIDQLIADRQAASTSKGDMLDLLLGLRMPGTGQPMPNQEIRDNLLTFIVTGSDTTALALTWSIYLLTQVPEWAEVLRSEADGVALSGFGLADVESLPLTKAFLDEVLRLFPSAPLLVRKAWSADHICGAKVRKGDLILAPIYTLHRHPGVWDDPLRFDPRRFLNPAAKRGNRYLPFGAGPRSCIGAGFALAEARIALSTFVRHLNFELQPGWDVQPLMMLTLKPDGGLPVLVQRRDNAASCVAPGQEPSGSNRKRSQQTEGAAV